MLINRSEEKMVKHTIEVFTSGCLLCQDTVKIVKEAKCPECTLTEFNILKKTEYLEKARKHGVKAVPSIVVDGKLAIEGKPTVQNVRKVLGL